MNIKVGSRTSTLARWQTDRVIDLVEEAHPGLDVEFVGMKTRGDEDRDRSVPEIGGKGLFTRRLEEALLDDEIDLAVHSLKDLPTELPDGLVYAGSPERGSPRDAFVSHRWETLDELPEEAVVATGSRRRRAQLRRRRPDVQFRDLRGNIGTRLDKLREHGWDGLVMAAVALERLGRTEVVAETLDPSDFVPAVGQGAIGVEIREARDDVRALLEPIFDPRTVEACRAERIFLHKLEGGCTVPIGGYARCTDESWEFHGWVGNVSGQTVIEDRTLGDDPAESARDMADAFIRQGAREILRDVRRSND